MIIQKAFFYNWYMFWLNNFQGGLNLLPWHTPTEITDTNQSVITKAICSGVADYILTMSGTFIGIAHLINLANYFQQHHLRKRKKTSPYSRPLYLLLTLQLILLHLSYGDTCHS